VNLCRCVATVLLRNKDQSRTIRSRFSQPASAGKEWTSVNCKPINAWHYNGESDSCAMRVSYKQKTVIARIKSINRNLRCRLQVFREVSGFNPNFQGGNEHSPSTNAYATIDNFISGFTKEASSSNESKKRY